MVADNKDLYKYSEKSIKNKNFKLWKEVNNIDMDITFKEKFYLYENSITNRPTCECGGYLKFIDMRSGYREFCSRSCMYKSEKTKSKRKETSVARWGVDNPSKSQKIKERVKKTNNKKFGTDWATQNDFIKKKIMENNIQKWGVDNPFKVSEFRNKAQNTMLEKWGVDNPMKSVEIKEKLKRNFLEKWGVDNPFKVSEFRNKAQNTMLEKWGVEYPLQNKAIMYKFKETSIRNWGVEYPLQNKAIMDKFKETSIRNWGVDNPSKSESVKLKIKNSILEKYGTLDLNNLTHISKKIKDKNISRYGVDHISKSEDYRTLKYSISRDSNYLNYLESGISLFLCDRGYEHEFQIDIDNYIKRSNSNIPLCTVCYPIGDLKSIKEREFIKFIELNYTDEIITSYRDGLKIDVYLPDLKLGFEFNGLYWHSDKFKEKSYHFRKTQYFQERGIRIIHIWEDSWDLKRSIIKSQILNLFNKNSKIWARQCRISEIKDNKIVRDFLNRNHIQGFVGSNLKLGLFHNDDLVSIMTFDKNEGRNKMTNNGWNLSRFCNKLDTNVVGGASKLLNYFIKKWNPNRIVSYADRDWSTGHLYYKLGFSFVGVSGPDYKYIVSDRRVHKSKFRKSNLNIIDGSSERMHTESIGLSRIWDCGKIKFELNIK